MSQVCKLKQQFNGLIDKLKNKSTYIDDSFDEGLEEAVAPCPDTACLPVLPLEEYRERERERERERRMSVRVCVCVGRGGVRERWRRRGRERGAGL